MHPFLEKAQQLKQQLNWSLIFGVSFFLAVVIGLIEITNGVSLRNVSTYEGLLIKYVGNLNDFVDIGKKLVEDVLG